MFNIYNYHRSFKVMYIWFNKALEEELNKRVNLEKEMVK